jgi:CRISPR-associated endonuclease/helicase Cas3
MTRINLDGVALRTYDEPYAFGYSPYGHQVRLRELFDESDRFVAVNDSPTGGGKTSSWLEPALAHRLDTVAVYPTNALVEDQRLGIEEHAEAVEHDVAVLKVTSDSLSQKRAEHGVQSNAKAIDRWIREHRGKQRLFLTNPDIFVMMCRDLYAEPARAFKQFELAVVDEFHRAGLKEQNTLRYLLDELLERDNAWLDRVVFLSATPDEEQEATFDRAMTVPYHRVTDRDDGQHEPQGAEKRPFADSLDEEWRAVMPPIELELRTAPTFGTADVLLDDEPESTLEFCRGGRTVLMLDGIHEVERVFTWLDDKLDRRVERIDGFHSENKREKLKSFDVLVSNSAVEVGIDFDVDRILFAGHDRPAFLQRLGRLRTEEQTQLARCYVPKSVGRGLDDLDETRVSRDDLRSRLETEYPNPKEPETFGWRYSASEALEHLEHRLRNATSDDAAEVKETGIGRIHRHFLADHGLTFADIKRTKDTIDWQALRSLQWYRGDSVQALVWDTIEGEMRSYNLFYLLRYGDVEFHEQSGFKRVVGDECVDEIERKARYVDGFCTYHGPIDTTDEGYGRDVAFTGGVLGSWIAETEDAGRKPCVRDGLKLVVDADGLKPVRNDSVNVLNQRLKNRSDRMGDPDEDDGGLLCFPVSGTTKMVKNTYGLGDFFFLYPVWLTTGDAYSLALGTDALYLHCHVQERQDDSLLIDV